MEVAVGEDNTTLGEMVDDVVWFSFNVGVLFDAKNEEVVFFELLINVLVVEIDCFIGKE